MFSQTIFENPKILIVDDIPQNIKILEKILINESFYILSAKNGKEALELALHEIPDLILLDIKIPDIDGFTICRILKNESKTESIPIIFLTGLDDTENIIKGFGFGAADYITKPFNPYELLARINTHLKLRRYTMELENKELHLVDLVEEKTKKLEKLTIAMLTSLETANRMSDDDTGRHIKRVSLYSEVLAKELGCSNEFVRNIKLYSTLHDIGKIGVPEKILKKPNKLTIEEYKIMKNHVEIGAKILANEEIDGIAKNIVKYHHERWDGKGYLKGLSGLEISLEARIVALADVYDALVSKRPYKKPLTRDETNKIIRENSGKHFQPEIVEAFFNKEIEFWSIRENYCIG